MSRSEQPRRLAVTLAPAAERHVKQRHPWVFDRGIVKCKPEGETGDLAVIFDRRSDRFLALARYDADSPIRLKVIEWQSKTTIDRAWFARKIEAARRLRWPLIESRHTNAYRLLFGENDGLPGLICDVYAGVAVLKVYSGIWKSDLTDIVACIREATEAKAVVLRLSRNVQKCNADTFPADGSVVSGDLTDEVVEFREHGLRFQANVRLGHKTGHFLDHRHNRRRVGELANGKTVLDVFAYSGGFSVHALASGAREVHAVDVSRQALEIARANAILNDCGDRLRLHVGDAFETLQEFVRRNQQFNFIVIDPPAFAKREREVERALKNYRRLARLGADLCTSSGMLVLASCSARVSADRFFEEIEAELERSGRLFQMVEKTAHDLDHPIGFPEGAYLKCGYYRCVE